MNYRILFLPMIFCVLGLGINKGLSQTSCCTTEQEAWQIAQKDFSLDLSHRNSIKQAYKECLAKCYYNNKSISLHDAYRQSWQDGFGSAEMLFAIADLHCLPGMKSEQECLSNCVKPDFPCATIRGSQVQQPCPEWDAYNKCIEDCDKGSTDCRENYFNYLNNLDSDNDGIKDLDDTTPFGSSVRIISPADGAIIPFVPDQSSITINVSITTKVAGQQIESARLTYDGPEGRRQYTLNLRGANNSQTIPLVLYGLGNQKLSVVVETKKGKQLTHDISVVTQVMDIRSNLTVKKDGIEFIYDFIVDKGPNNKNRKQPYELGANKQIIKVTVHNLDTVEAKNVCVQFSEGPVDQDGEVIRDSLKIGDIPKQSSKYDYFIWDLNGQQKDDWRLYAHAYIPNAADVSPDDNFASQDLSILFAYNGQRAYDMSVDAYSFENIGVDTNSWEDSYKGLVSYLLTEAFTISPTEVGIWEQFEEEILTITGPLFYSNYESYISTLTELGIGGMCHGYAASSLDFFQYPSKNPFSKNIAAVSYQESGIIPFAYHIDQMTRFYYKAMIGHKNHAFYKKDEGIANTYHNLKNLLSKGQGGILSFDGKNKDQDGKEKAWGHSVMVYRLLEVDGQDPIFYTYDSEYPLDLLISKNINSFVRIGKDLSGWKNHKTYYIGSVDEIWGYPVRLKLSADEIKWFFDIYKRSLDPYSEFLNLIDKYIIQLSCPADLLLTDDKGRRTGLINGRLVSEIPGVEAGALGETEFYYVPNNLEVNIEVRGHGDGTGKLTTIRPNGKMFDISTIKDIPLSNGSVANTSTLANGKLNDFNYSNRSFSAIESTISSADPLWDQIGIENKTPIASFSIMPRYPRPDDEIVLVSTSTNPDGDMLTYEWYIDDELIGNSERIEANTLSKGAHEIKLIVTDNQGSSSFSQETLKVRSKGISWDDIDEDTLILIGIALAGLVIMFGLFYFIRKRKKIKQRNLRNQSVSDKHLHGEKVTKNTNKSENKYCTNCGRPSKVDDKFCQSCGHAQ